MCIFEDESHFNCKLEDIYLNEQAWEWDYDLIKAMEYELDEILQNVNDSHSNLLIKLRSKEMIDRKYEMLFSYANLRVFKNYKDELASELKNKIINMKPNFDRLESIIKSEVTKLCLKEWLELCNQNPEFKDFDNYYTEVCKESNNVLSDDCEILISKLKKINGLVEDNFYQIVNGDIKFKNIQTKSGQSVAISHGGYNSLLSSVDQTTRKSAYENYYRGFGEHINALTSNYITKVELDNFDAKARGFNNTLEAALSKEQVNVDVYMNLIECTHDNLHLYHHFLELKKDSYECNCLNMYDLNLPMDRENEIKIPFYQAKNIIKNALIPLGCKYLENLDMLFENNWIDLYKDEFKTHFPFSVGIYDVHPYIFVNYEDDLVSLSTLIHEVGHALHYLYSKENQPYKKSKFSIFTSEVIALTNEILLLVHLIETASNSKDKMIYIENYLERFRLAVFRQTMTAEFELLVHEKVRKGEVITASVLCNVYEDLNNLYSGGNIKKDEFYQYDWSRIPHLYSGFYVYKYALGFAAASILAEKLQNTSGNQVTLFLDLIKDGCCNAPIDQLKKVGVDITDHETLKSGFATFEKYVYEYVKLKNGEIENEEN